jgi:hypothetical protein
MKRLGHSRAPASIDVISAAALMGAPLNIIINHTQPIRVVIMILRSAGHPTNPTRCVLDTLPRPYISTSLTDELVNSISRTE